MTVTAHDLYNYLRDNLDEITLCEVLEISSEDLVDRFQDRIDDKYEELLKEFEEDIRGTGHDWDEF